MVRTRASATQTRAQRRQRDIRKLGRQARAGLSDQEREAASEVIAEKVIRASWFRRSEYIACYLPTPDEVDTWSIIARAWRMKKRVFAPVIEKNFRMQFCELTEESRLHVNRYGLYEPGDGELITARLLDTVITPLVAFDDVGNRVGMGGGYFDRTFSFLKHRRFLFHPKLVGLAFACQKVEEITPNPWDIRLFTVVNELE